MRAVVVLLLGYLLAGCPKQAILDTDGSEPTDASLQDSGDAD